MTVTERTYIYDHTTQPGAVLLQDVSGFVDHERSIWNSTTRPNPDPSTLVLTMDANRLDLPTIREGFRVINGFYSDASETWILARFGGYIKEEKRSDEAQQITFTCTLVDYTCYFERRRILVWPGTIDPPYVGFPPDWPAWYWLWGSEAAGDPADGIFTRYFTRMDSGGIDPIFSDIILSAESLPGNDGKYYGLFSFCTVGEALTQICEAAAWAQARTGPGGLFTPGVWIQAVVAPDGSDIIPQPRVANIADVPHPAVAVLAQTPVVGAQPPEFPIEQPYLHAREWCDGNNVTILGEGGDPTLPDHPIVWAEANSAEHDARYLAEFSSEGRWDLIVIEPHIHTLALADETAVNLQAATGAGRGSYEAESDQLFHPGAWVGLRIEDQALNGVFPVRTVSMIRHGSIPIFHYRLGFDVGRAADVLGSGRVKTALTVEQYMFDKRMFRVRPGAPRATTADRHPMQGEQNTFQARHYAAHALRIVAPVSPPPPNDPDGADRVSLLPFIGTDNETRMHAGPQGEPRGHSFLIGTLPAGNTGACLAMTQTMRFVRDLITCTTGETPGTCLYAVNDTLVTFPFTVKNGDRFCYAPVAIPPSGMEISLCEFVAEPVVP